MDVQKQYNFSTVSWNVAFCIDVSQNREFAIENAMAMSLSKRLVVNGPNEKCTSLNSKILSNMLTDWTLKGYWIYNW